MSHRIFHNTCKWLASIITLLVDKAKSGGTKSSRGLHVHLLGNAALEVFSEGSIWDAGLAG